MKENGSNFKYQLHDQSHSDISFVEMLILECQAIKEQISFKDMPSFYVDILLKFEIELKSSKRILEKVNETHQMYEEILLDEENNIGLRKMASHHRRSCLEIENSHLDSLLKIRNEIIEVITNFTHKTNVE